MACRGHQLGLPCRRRGGARKANSSNHGPEFSFSQFGEIYFSTIYYNSIKGWHLHKEATLNYVCVKGEVKLVLFDDREGSPTKGEYQELILSPKNYFLVTIPPNIWNGFKGIDKSESIITNCLTLPHNEKEMVRRDPHDKYFKYDWS